MQKIQHISITKSGNDYHSQLLFSGGVLLPYEFLGIATDFSFDG